MKQFEHEITLQVKGGKPIKPGYDSHWELIAVGPGPEGWPEHVTLYWKKEIPQ